MFMRSLIYNNAKIFRYICTGILCTLMVAVSEILGDPEMIFPEAEALFIGMLIADKPLWNISKRLFMFIMGISALAGLWLSIYRDLFLRFIFDAESPGLWLERFSILAAICVAYAFVSFLLITYQAALLPAVSACVLPILTNAHSWTYPVSVIVVTLATLISNSVAKRANLIPRAGEPVDNDSKSEAKNFDSIEERSRLLACFPIVFAAGGAAVMSGFKFAAAPPLIVALLTFAGKSSPLQNKKLKIYLLILICATVGAASVLLLYIQLKLPMTVAVILTVIIISVIFYKSQILFPPAGALAILPAILPENYVLIYPLMIAAGAAVFILAGSAVAGMKFGEVVSKEQLKNPVIK